MAMKLQPKNLNLAEWYDWLTDCGLVLGKDYRWAWQDDSMAVEFLDPNVELLMLLKKVHD